MRNPFTPNFGQVPIHMAGRSFLISEMSTAFDNAPGDPNLTSILVGARGTGKTALLTCFANLAEQGGWLAVNVSCIPGMLEDVLEQTQRKASAFIEKDPEKHLSGISFGQVFGLEWERKEAPDRNWRTRMADILDVLDELDIGLLITIDEVNPKLDEMIQIASVYQHFIREERKVALAMAGLPYKVSALLSDQSVSFLRRASQQRLGRIEDYEVELAFRQTVEAFDKTVDSKALEKAVAAIDGFPFMMQLVGFRSWQMSGDRTCIEVSDIEQGIELAGNDMKVRVLRATLDELSERDLEFLQAMLPDEELSATADIEKRLKKSPSHVSTYRRRLLEQGVIENRGRTRVGFALPMLREYLPEYMGSNL